MFGSVMRMILKRCVETDNVVEEEGHQEGCGHVGIIEEEAILSVFILRAEGDRILLTLFIDGDQSLAIIKRGIVFTFRWLSVSVQFDHQVYIGHNIGRREEEVEDRDGQDLGHLNLCPLEYHSYIFSTAEGFRRLDK